MTQVLAAASETPKCRWTPERFARAWEAGVFDGERVELLDGELVPAQTRPWHGETTALAIDLLPREGVRKAQATLPAGNSLPDPDVWVGKADAKPKAQHGGLLNSWRPTDVLLVVEVSDASNRST